MTKKKQTKKNMKYGILVSVVMIMISVAFLYQAGQELFLTIKLQNDLKEAKVVVEELNREKEELKASKEKLEDAEYVKYLARGKYNLSKDGEQIFKLPDED